MKSKYFIISLFLAGFILSGCNVTYKVDVQQGNVVTQEMLDKLETGMPARKVRLIMGTPLIRDAFHSQRWDYFYSFQTGHKTAEQRRITLLFEKNALTSVKGDVKVNLKKSRPTQQPLLRDEPLL
ncbi:MAG: outer membrane protein assembly factor BamE [Gammaproteobacteria bacterium]|nr:outer membrane protein assembly factor BamE [Gammaproteobacteria bacterium]